MKATFLIALIVAFGLPIAGADARIWTSLDGKTTEAEFVESDGKAVTIKRTDGRTYTLALEKLSQADRSFVARKLKDRKDAAGASEKKDGPGVTGEIRDPKEGEKMPREFAVKGRTRDAPDGFVAMVFQRDIKTGNFFPHREYSDANRSFSTFIYHNEADPPEWEVHLYVLPEAAAKRLAAWHKRAAAFHKAGQRDKIVPYEASLTDEAIQVATVKYYLETN